MKRAHALEKAGNDYLTLKGFTFISAKDQTLKCLKCGQFQKVRTQGWDTFVFTPRVFFVEYKTGGGRLSRAQQEWKAKCEKVGIVYLEVHDNIDVLIDFAESKGA